jgi:hypothetical protein
MRCKGNFSLRFHREWRLQMRAERISSGVQKDIRAANKPQKRKRRSGWHPAAFRGSVMSGYEIRVMGGSLCQAPGGAKDTQIAKRDVNAEAYAAFTSVRVAEGGAR